MRKKILVTGANGYIGRHIVSKLLSTNKYTVIATDIKKNSTNDDNFVELDLLNNYDNPDLYHTLNSPDICIHLAWQNGFNHSAISHLQNIDKHYCLLKNLIDSGCKNISVMGTMHEVGYYEGAITETTPCNPLSLYGIAKNALRQAILTYSKSNNVSLKWLRAYYITGDDNNNKSIFSKILQFAKEGKKSFPFTDGKPKYDFLDIEQLATQIILASTQNDIDGIINCCSGSPVSLKDKVEEFISNNNLQIEPEYGAFPNRAYDSPAIWGDATIINLIKSRSENEI